MASPNKVKVQLSFNKEIIERIDSYAEYVGVSRSAAINMLVARAMTEDEAIKLIPQLINAANKVKEDTVKEK